GNHIDGEIVPRRKVVNGVEPEPGVQCRREAIGRIRHEIKSLSIIDIVGAIAGLKRQRNVLRNIVCPAETGARRGEARNCSEITAAGCIDSGQRFPLRVVNKQGYAVAFDNSLEFGCKRSPPENPVLMGAKIVRPEQRQTSAAAAKPAAEAAETE